VKALLRPSHGLVSNCGDPQRTTLPMNPNNDAPKLVEFVRIVGWLRAD
jgi:hypothetical protein